jgi:hypothetical protein
MAQLVQPRRLTFGGRSVIVNVRTSMRLALLLVAGILLATSAAGQQAEPSPSAAPPSSAPDAASTSTLDLPVSLDRIRGALDRPAGGSLLKGLDEAPTFRVEIRERQKIQELLSTLNFKSGPTPAGGLYGYEQQRLMFPSVDNPLAQPYAAFNQSQLLTIIVENLVGKYLAGHALDSITKSQREHAEAAARREVDQAISNYCTGKPNGGAGIELCDQAPASR